MYSSCRARDHGMKGDIVGNKRQSCPRYHLETPQIRGLGSIFLKRKSKHQADTKALVGVL